MNWPRATRIFIFVIAAVIGLYDLAAAAFGGAEGTVSLVLWHMSGAQWRATTLVLCLGYFLGHIFGRISES